MITLPWVILAGHRAGKNRPLIMVIVREAMVREAMKRMQEAGRYPPRAC